MIFTLIAVLSAHFLGDFVLQTDWQAQNKYRSLKALLWHTVPYSLVFLLVDWRLAVITFVCHTATDFFTSKLTHKLAGIAKETGNWHDFFSMVGFDQWLHHMQLILTVWLLSPK